jgi:hypothetical protein
LTITECPLDLVLAKDACDDVRHVIQFHDLTINDGVCLKVFVAETDELKVAGLTLQLDGFDGTGTDVHSDKVLFAETFFEHDLIFPLGPVGWRLLAMELAQT